MKNIYLPWLIGAIVVVLLMLVLLFFFQSMHSSFLVVFFLELLALSLLAVMIRAYRTGQQRGQGWRLQQDLLQWFAIKFSLGQRGRNIGTMLNMLTVAVVTITVAWLILLWTGTAVLGTHTQATPIPNSISTPTKTPRPTPLPTKTPAPSRTPTK